MWEKRCLAESFLVYWQLHAFSPSPSLSIPPLHSSLAPVVVAGPDETRRSTAAAMDVSLIDHCHLFAHGGHF
jgi:hypothetical protein